MENAAEFKVETGPDGATAALSGAWTAAQMGNAGPRLRRELGRLRDVRFDLTDISRLDTAGAFAVVRAAGGPLDPDRVNARPARRERGKRFVIHPPGSKAGRPGPPGQPTSST